MAGPTVYADVADALELEGVGHLFAGKKFWVAQRMPQRNRLLDEIKANGGEVVALEKRADYMIADHFRKDCPAGSISYEFVTKSIREGRLRDAQDHRAGPPLGEAREPGAINRPAKGGRTPYTPEEDRLLYRWVRDCLKNGTGTASGNEIYKQLEAKHPRHTWQSWRDRYLKQLSDRPPSAFNIPDNAPPSPPSDHPPAPRPPPVTSSSKQAKKASPKGNKSGHDYTLDQLNATFSSEDWEELYAFVDIIEAVEGEERYDEAWEQWAESQDNQTVEQWRQYFEKVVRPQWLRDPDWKREQIKQRVEAKHEQKSASSQPTSQQQQSVRDKDDVTTPMPASIAMRPPAVGVEKSTENDDTPSMATNPAATADVKVAAAKTSSENKLMSSSTVQHESPRYITDMYQNILKRVRGGGAQEEQQDELRSSKRQKSASPGLDRSAQQNFNAGTQNQPLEIPSSRSSTSASQPEADDEQAQEQIRNEAEQTFDEDRTLVNGDVVESLQDTNSVQSDDFLDIDQLAPPHEDIDRPSDDDLPSNTPTPRAPRQKPSNFDTQAILSSPSQGIGISRLPRPFGYTQDLQTQTEPRSSSVAPHPESDASTTQSLHEFRRSLNGENDSTLPLPRSPSHSPTPSDGSNTSGDPDPPLEADEFSDYYAELNAQGFSDDFISAALRRTRCRPDLAELVLDAWKDGKPLPNRRGVWSLADDGAAESGDGVELMRLEEKHTLDGWGGITERIRFLESYRSR